MYGYIFIWQCCVWFCSPAVTKRRQAKEEINYEETPQEKKLRLAKLYLEQLKEEGNIVYTKLYFCTTILCDVAVLKRGFVLNRGE